MAGGDGGMQGNGAQHGGEQDLRREGVRGGTGMRDWPTSPSHRHKPSRYEERGTTPKQSVNGHVAGTHSTYENGSGKRQCTDRESDVAKVPKTSGSRGHEQTRTRGGVGDKQGSQGSTIVLGMQAMGNRKGAGELNGQGGRLGKTHTSSSMALAVPLAAAATTASRNAGLAGGPRGCGYAPFTVSNKSAFHAVADGGTGGLCKAARGATSTDGVGIPAPVDSAATATSSGQNDCQSQSSENVSDPDHTILSQEHSSSFVVSTPDPADSLDAMGNATEDQVEDSHDDIREVVDQSEQQHAIDDASGNGDNMSFGSSSPPAYATTQSADTDPLYDYPPLSTNEKTSFTADEIYERFDRLMKLGEGTYGTVFKVMDQVTSRIVALKRVRLEDGNHGVSTTAMREIAYLKRLRKHPNIVTLLDVIIEENMHLHMIFEYLEYDLKKYIDKMNYHRQRIAVIDAKSILRQLIAGVQACHESATFHRDLKPSNILLDQEGHVKIADFGLARNSYPSGDVTLTPQVVTLWYRSPELLFGAQTYTASVDMWSIGCIIVEMITGQPLFQGDSHIDQIFQIAKVLGPTRVAEWPELAYLPEYRAVCWNDTQEPIGLEAYCSRMDAQGLDFVTKLLTYNPCSRLTAKEALNHPFLSDVAETDIRPLM